MAGTRFVLFALVLLAGCGDNPVEPTLPEPPGEPGESITRQELEESRRRFEQTVGASYTYEYQNVCFCGPDTRANVRLTVRDGARVSVVTVEGGAPIPRDRWPGFLTVGEIFDDLERSLGTGAASVRATFDPELGYPRDVFIDVDERIADEERGYTVRNLAVDR